MLSNVGRYTIRREIASGGMATVHLGQMTGAAGFSRPVAIKRLHAQFAKNPELVAMFLDEARVTGCIRHPNVVSTLDVVAMPGELFIVMDYVHGESLFRLVGMRYERTGRPAPVRVAAAILANVLHGLHAAHEARSERGEPLRIVHRDVSPQNILVGKDGIARVVDFGIAKARERSMTTRDGVVKGKVSYMAPEQISGRTDHRSDIYACAVVLWETLTGRKLFPADGDLAAAERMRTTQVKAPSAFAPAVPRALDAIVLKGLAKAPDQRFHDAAQMAEALEHEVGIASPAEVAQWAASITADPDPDGTAATRAFEIDPTEISVVALKEPPSRARAFVLAAGAAVALASGVAAAAHFVPARRHEIAVHHAPSLPPAVLATVAPEPVAAPVTSIPVVSVAELPPAAPPAVPRHVSCDPPYTVDGRGIRHMKRECLKE